MSLILKTIKVIVLYQLYQNYPNYIFLGEETLGPMMDMVAWLVQPLFYLSPF